MTDLVVVSLEAWDSVWRRNQHLVWRLLEADPTLRVLFVEPAADPVHDARRGARVARGNGLRTADLPGAHDRLWLFQPTKWLPRRCDPRADARLSAAVVRAASKVGMTDPLAWINDPAAADLLRRTSWPALYDITDDWLAADRSRREHDKLVEDEAYLLRHCRQVVVCSPRLMETKHADRVTLIQNAVETQAYAAPLSRPSDVPAGTVVLYLGTLHRDRLDLDLCIALAKSLPEDASFVLVGPVALDNADASLLAGAGALLLGPREHTSVPAYLKNADVLAVPHVVTAFTDSLDPIKVYEYLAAGRPIVSTPVAGFRELRLPQVDVALAEDFCQAIKTRLETLEGATATAVDVPSWADRAEAMRTVIAELGESRRVRRG